MDSYIVAEKNEQLLVCSLKEEQRIKEFGKNESKDMKCKFENSVNMILFVMFSLVLVTISFRNCKGCSQESSNTSNLGRIEIDTIDVDTIHN